MHIPHWLATPFDMKIDNEGHEYDLEDELIEMHVDLKAKALFTSYDFSGAISMLLLSTPSSEKQPNISYLHSQPHKWLKQVLAM